MARFVLRPRASADIDGIWDYTESRWGTAQAIKYTRNIWEIIERVAENPDLGRRCDDDPAGHFKIRAGSHFVIYRLVGDKIGIVRILHQSMDFGRHL